MHVKMSSAKMATILSRGDELILVWMNNYILCKCEMKLLSKPGLAGVKYSDQIRGATCEYNYGDDITFTV